MTGLIGRRALDRGTAVIHRPGCVVDKSHSGRMPGIGSPHEHNALPTQSDLMQISAAVVAATIAAVVATVSLIVQAVSDSATRKTGRQTRRGATKATEELGLRNGQPNPAAHQSRSPVGEVLLGTREGRELKRARERGRSHNPHRDAQAALGNRGGKWARGRNSGTDHGFERTWKEEMTTYSASSIELAEETEGSGACQYRATQVGGC